jgi:hypothetical protein
MRAPAVGRVNKPVWPSVGATAMFVFKINIMAVKIEAYRVCMDPPSMASFCLLTTGTE